MHILFSGIKLIRSENNSYFIMLTQEFRGGCWWVTETSPRNKFALSDKMASDMKVCRKQNFTEFLYAEQKCTCTDIH